MKEEKKEGSCALNRPKHAIQAPETNFRAPETLIEGSPDSKKGGLRHSGHYRALFRRPEGEPETTQSLHASPMGINVLIASRITRAAPFPHAQWGDATWPASRSALPCVHTSSRHVPPATSLFLYFEQLQGRSGNPDPHPKAQKPLKWSPKSTRASFFAPIHAKTIPTAPDTPLTCRLTNILQLFHYLIKT